MRIWFLYLAVAAGLFAVSAVAHEYAHCASAGTFVDCRVVVHTHPEHILHASHYHPSDHSWLIPTHTTLYTLSLFGISRGLIFDKPSLTPNP